MNPGATRWTLVVQGRQQARVTIVVEVYRHRVWLTTVDIPAVSEAILTSGQADHLTEILNRSATEAREGARNNPDRA